MRLAAFGVLALLSCSRPARAPEPEPEPEPVNERTAATSTPTRSSTAPRLPETDSDASPRALNQGPEDGGEAATAGTSTESPSAPHPLVIHLVPLGSVDQATLDEAVRGLASHAPVEPVVEARQPFPGRAEDRVKGSYRAEILLDWLARLPIPAGGKIMGVADVDIVTEKGTVKSWGILGLGAIDGRVSVLSTYRMKRKWEHGGAPDAVVRERLWKTALHELGHTLGLEHCPNAGCIMEDAHGTVRTTDREKELCPVCAAKFARAVSGT